MEKNVLYATQIQYLKNLTIDEYEILKLLCKVSNSLYNVALYNVRQQFFQTKQYLSYNENYKLSKSNENYKLLNSNMSQQILREVDNNFKSFFALLNKKTNGNYSSKVKIPHYKEKDGFYKLKIQQIQIDEDGYMLLPMSVSFRKTYGSMKFKVPSNLNYSKIKYVEVIPMFHSKRFELHWVYETQIENTNNLLDETKYLSIDLGVNNLMTCVSNDGFAFIIDRKKLKSINQYVNKRNAFLQSIRTTQKNNNPLDENGNTIGKMGLELYLDSYLRGTDGSRTYQVDKDGYVLPGMKEEKVSAVNGDNVYLTLDSGIQSTLEQSF